MFNLRLRQAETAFAEGRLNEAARLAEQQGVRDHREGQLLLTKIVDAFVERGREHLEAGRLNEAVVDCGEAKKLAGELAAIAELASEIASAKQDVQKKAVRKQRVTAEVGREIVRGELELGEKLLAKFEADGASVGSVAGQINDQIAVGRERIEAAVVRARRVRFYISAWMCCDGRCSDCRMVSGTFSNTVAVVREPRSLLCGMRGHGSVSCTSLG